MKTVQLKNGEFMSKKPCDGYKCRAYLKKNGFVSPGGYECSVCGIEGPIYYWYLEKENA